jgi:hypothetical protein
MELQRLTQTSRQPELVATSSCEGYELDDAGPSNNHRKYCRIDHRMTITMRYRRSIIGIG